MAVRGGDCSAVELSSTPRRIASLLVVTAASRLEFWRRDGGNYFQDKFQLSP